MMALLSYNMIHQSLGYSLVTITKVINAVFFLTNQFFGEKYSDLFTFCYAKSFSLDTYGKTTYSLDNFKLFGGLIKEG